MATIVTTPLVAAQTDKFPVVPVANGIVPDEALAITCLLQFNSTAQAILIDLSESARKFNTVPIQGAFIDTSSSTIDLRVENSVTGQSVLAKAGLQGYYNLLIPMPAKLIAVLASAPAGPLNITMILYNTVIESEIWGFTQVPGPPGPQGPIGPAGPTGPQGPAGAGAPPATTTSLGSVIVGANLDVQVDGTLSVPIATGTVPGVVKGGGNVSIAGDGTITVSPTAGFQTPWLSNINGAGFALNSPGNINNCTGVGIGTAATASSPFWLNLPVTSLPMTVANSNGSGAAGMAFYNDQSVIMALGLGGSSRPLVQERNNAFFNLSTGNSYVWEINNAEQLRLTSAGNLWVGLGGITPASTGKLAVRTGTNQVFGVWGPVSGPGGVTLQSSDDAGAAYQPMQIETSQLLLNVNGANVGVGTSGPLYGLDLRTPGAIASQMHISSTNTDAGAYLTTTNDNGLNVSAGAAFNGSNWIAKSTAAAILSFNGSTFAFNVNSGLTPGNSYNPGALMFVTPTGVGIGPGTNNPLSECHIRSGANQNILLGSVTGVSSIQAVNDAGSAFVPLQYFAGSHAFIFGNVGLGLVPNPAYQLQLSTDAAAKLSTNTWTISSGAKVKRNVKRLTGGLDIINKLRPTEAEYNGKGGTPAGKRVVSLIAEEVREILPHTVTEDADGNLGFNVHEVIHHLILAVQQLSKKLEKKST